MEILIRKQMMQINIIGNGKFVATSQTHFCPLKGRAKTSN